MEIFGRKKGKSAESIKRKILRENIVIVNEVSTELSREYKEGTMERHQRSMSIMSEAIE